MKRFAFSMMCLVSAFACSGSPEVEAPTSRAAAPPVTVAPADDVIELTEDQSDAADDLVHTVPTGTFADVGAFCSAQMKLIAPKVEEANAAYKTDGYGDMNLKPSCEETPNVVEGAVVALGGAYEDLKAVTFETGYSTESYLLVKLVDGWAAVRSPVLYVNHNDPGCGSIERPGAILDVYVEHGALVVKSTAGRTFLNAKDEYGDLTLTYARACRRTAAGIACGTPEVTDAKVTIQTDDEPDAPLKTRFFSTTFTVGDGVAIEPATRFDEEQL